MPNPCRLQQPDGRSRRGNLQSIEIRKLLRATQAVNKMMTQIESELLSMGSCGSKTIGTDCKSARFTFKKPPLIGCSHHYSIHLIRPINTLRWSDPSLFLPSIGGTLPTT
jgi:hypothetical protein